MKTPLSLVLAAAVALSLCACGSGGAPAASTPAASTPATSAPAASTPAAPAGAVIELKIGVSTADPDPRNIAASQFAEDVAKATNGAVTAKVFPSGQLGGDADLINSMALGSGTVDIIITDASNFAAYEPKMGISALPFQFSGFDEAWAFMDSAIQAEAEASLVEQNMRVLAHYDNGFRCVTSSKGPVNSPGDMKGLLIRTPENPVIMATMSALGANPQPLSFSELYQALRAKTYDAQENPIPVIYNNKLNEVQEYLSVTNHIYSGMCFTIAESTWQKLSAGQQAAVQEAASASAKTDRDMNREQTESLAGELEKAGMKINYPDLAPFAEATACVLTDNADQYGDLLTKLADWQAAR